MNHRFFNPAIKVPASLSAMESELREILRARVGRGHVSLTVRTEADMSSTVGINEERFAQAVEMLKSLQSRHGIAESPDLATVLRVPGVVGTAADSTPIIPQDVTEIVGRAVDALEEMRRTEGTRLTAFLRDHIEVVASALLRIGTRAPVRLQEQRLRLQAAVQEILGGMSVDEQRMAPEIAILADRLDITEELNRFEAHTQAVRATLAAPDPDGVGKRLGFILQEMLRETNTIGSKANDSAILAEVVAIKEELERLREQVENVA